MSENDSENTHVEKTTETIRETVDPGMADRREELRTPEPEVVKETVTETRTEPGN